MKGRHPTKKDPSDPSFSAQWSGVSYAPHCDCICLDCGTDLHKEGDCHYCPRCDDFKNGQKGLCLYWNIYIE